MKYALINHVGRIVQVVPLGQNFPISPDFTWVTCPDDVVAYSWTYDVNTGFSPPPPQDLEEAKAEKIVVIELERDAAAYADVEVIDHTWQADARSQSLMATAILLAQAEVYVPNVWRTADNIDVEVDLADLVLIAGTVAAQTEAAYATSWVRKAAVEAATTVEEVEAA